MIPIEEQICNQIEKTKRELINKFQSASISTQSWNKLSGDICCRIFSHFIKSSLPPQYTVSSPNAYINGFHTEFDLLVIESGSAPIEFTNVYYPKSVKAGIEFKTRGIYINRKNKKLKFNKIKQNFVDVNALHPHINFSYLTYKSVASTKRKGSINYFKLAEKYLGDEYLAFYLKDSRTNQVNLGQWEHFIKNLIK